MRMFSKTRIKNEAQAIKESWERKYADERLPKDAIESLAKSSADQFVCACGLRNADKITLVIWRQYCHVLPVKGDVKTANNKKLVNAVRRQIVRHKKTRANDNMRPVFTKAW